MGLLGQVLTGVVASRMGRGGLGGGLGGGMMGGPLGGALGGGMMGGGLPGALGGAVLGGMGRGRGSPVLKGLALLLAAKAAHGYMQRRQQENAGQTTGGSLGSPAQGSGGPGGLLGGVAGGGGLGALVEQFTRNGHGDAISSWIGKGPNQKLPPQQLAAALGPDTVQALTAETGLPEDELLEELSDALPEAVDQLSPDGATPDPSLLSGDDLDLDELHPNEIGTGPRPAT